MFAFVALLILSLTLVCIPSVQAQFSQVYGNSSNNFFNRLIPDGQDFYVLGRDDGKATVSRINSAGVLSWTRVLDMPSRLTDGMIVGGSGNMIVVGATTPVDSSNHSLLGEITRQGVFTCLKTLDVPGAEALTRMDRNADGTFSVVGTQALPGFSQDVFVLNVSPGCLINSKKVISSPGVDNFANDIKVLCNGDFLVAGDYDGRAVMFEFSPTGQYVTGSHNPFNYTYNDIANTSNCDILVVANSLVSAPPIIQRFDADWLPLWEASIVGLQTLNKVVEDGNGNILVTARALIGGVTRSVILKIDDSSGSPILSWGGARYIENSESSFVGGSVALPISGGIAIIDGRDGNPNGFGMPDAFMAYTDDDLTSDCTRDLVLDVVIESTLFEGPIIEIFNYDVPLETMVTYSSVDWEQREACTGNPNPDSCVCSMPEFSLTYEGVDYPLSCLPHGGQTPVVGCANGLVTTGGFFGCIDPNTGEPCLIETPVVWLLSGPNGPIDGGTGSNYSAYIFPPSYFQTNGTYTLTMATLCPGQQDSCVCVLDWIVECNSESIFKCGMAVVSCFSGLLPPSSNTANPNGPVLALVDLRNHATAPLGVNWSALTNSPSGLVHLPDWESRNMGQVFGVTIDNNYNVYASASTIYGKYLPTGMPNTTFGNVYKIDASNGTVSGFNTSLIPQDLQNPAGLGDVWYDQTNNQIFVSNFHDGLVYRFDMSGNQLPGTYNFPGATYGTPSPGFIPRGERVWAVAVHNNRLYFSVWNEDWFRPNPSVKNQIWSVQLDPSSSPPGAPLSNSLVLEKNMPDLITIDPLTGAPITNLYSSPVSDITFSENGSMLVAERTMNNDFGDARNQAYNQAHLSRIIEFSGASWLTAKIVYTGNAKNHLNSAGGIDYGYDSFDPGTTPLPMRCDSIIWSTGDALRYPSFNTIPEPLALFCANNPGLTNDYVYGLAGMPQRGNSNQSIPASNYVNNTSIYIDVDNNICNNNKIQIGDVDVFRNCINCEEPSPVPCDSLMVMIQSDPGNLCCYSVDIKNRFGPNISKLQMDLVSPGSASSVIFNTSQIASGFQYVASNSDRTICITHASGSIPFGMTNDVIHFCYSGVDSPGEVPQTIKFTWWQNVGGSDIPTECMQTFTTECQPKPPKDPCVLVTPLNVECNPDNVFEYILTFKVTNLSSIPLFNGYTINLYGLPSGFSFSPCIGSSTPLSNISLSIPGAPLQPTMMSGNMCVKIISTSPILSPQTICVQAKLIGIVDCCTVDDKFCFTVQPCCNPCDEISISTTTLQQDSLCCHSLNVVNNCPYPYFTKIEAEILTQGVTYGYYALSSPFIGFWSLANSTNKKICIAPPFGGTIPGGTLTNLVSFCLDNINSSLQVPQQIIIRWITPDINGMDSIACDTILEFNCVPVVDYKCLSIDSLDIVCLADQNKYLLNFKVTNHSTINFTATSLDLILLAPTDLVFFPSSSISFSPQLGSGNSQWVSVCLYDTDGLPGSGVISFIPKLSFQAADTCCFEGVPVNIPLPPCDTCYCKSPGFTDMILHWDNGPGISIQCETSYDGIPCPQPGDGYFFTGKFECEGDSCEVIPYVSWELTGPTGFHFGSVQASPYFGIHLLPSQISQNGIFTMSLTSFCGTDTCKCDFQFAVQCDTLCPCDLDVVNALKKAVGQGFAVSSSTSSCKVCFTPIALTDCEKVEWHVNNSGGPLLGTSTGNQTFCHTFSPGTYNIVMIVTRLKPDGTLCESFVKPKIINVACIVNPACNNSSLRNSSFSEGAIAGGFNSGGASVGWSSIHEEIEVIEGALGSLEGWSLRLFGNLDKASVLTSVEAICLARDTGLITLRLEGEPIPGAPQVPTGRGRSSSLAFYVSQGNNFEIGNCEEQNCYHIATIPIEDFMNGEWYDVEVPYDLRGWNLSDTCGSGALIRPIVFVTNDINTIQGGDETYSYAQIDNFCLDGMTVAVSNPFDYHRIRIFPNPTTGLLNIEMPNIIQSDISLQIISLTGQQILGKTAEPGISVQTIDASALPQGMYFLQVLSKGQVIAVNKFVKQ